MVKAILPLLAFRDEVWITINDLRWPAVQVHFRTLACSREQTVEQEKPFGKVWQQTPSCSLVKYGLVLRLP
jgi:hypothetical protein